MKGGGLSKSDTLKRINEMEKSSIKDIAIVYEGIDEVNYKFIEVPQGHIYSYDGNELIDIGGESIIQSGNNIIPYIMGMGPCRGIMVLTESKIYIGHLDSIREPSKLRLGTIEKCLNDLDIINIYYIMGTCSFSTTLSKACSFCDISTEVIEIINKKKLIDKTKIIEDFLTITSKFGYDIINKHFLIFPSHPEIRDNFIMLSQPSEIKRISAESFLKKVVKLKETDDFNKKMKWVCAEIHPESNNLLCYVHTNHHGNEMKINLSSKPRVILKPSDVEVVES